MSNSPSRNAIDEAMATFITAAARNLGNATSTNQPQMPQQVPLQQQMGINAAPFHVNAMPQMPPNYANNFQPQPSFTQQQFNPNQPYAQPYSNNWNQPRPPPRSNTNGSTGYGICRTTGVKAEDCNCPPPSWCHRTRNSQATQMQRAVNAMERMVNAQSNTQSNTTAVATTNAAQPQVAAATAPTPAPAPPPPAAPPAAPTPITIPNPNPPSNQPAQYVQVGNTLYPAEAIHQSSTPEWAKTMCKTLVASSQLAEKNSEAALKQAEEAAKIAKGLEATVAELKSQLTEQQEQAENQSLSLQQLIDEKDTRRERIEDYDRRMQLIAAEQEAQRVKEREDEG